MKSLEVRIETILATSSNCPIAPEKALTEADLRLAKATLTTSFRDQRRNDRRDSKLAALARRSTKVHTV